MKKIFLKIKNPLNICLVYLICFFMYASYNIISDNINSLPKVIFNLSTVIGIVYFIPWVFGKYKIKTFNNTDSLISAFIFLLVVDTNQNIFITLAMLCIYLFGRTYIRYKNAPIFNPVAFSIFGFIALTYFVNIHGFISWWGTSFAPRFTSYNLSIAIIFTLSIGLYLSYKFQRLIIIGVSFLTASFFYLINQFFNPNIDLSTIVSSYIATFFEGTMFFALLLMLVEPKTSPVKKYSQVIYGFIFGFSWIIYYLNHLYNPVIFAILTSNLFYFSEKIIRSLSKKKELKITNDTSIIRSDIYANTTTSEIKENLSSTYQN